MDKVSGELSFSRSEYEAAKASLKRTSKPCQTPERPTTMSHSASTMSHSASAMSPSASTISHSASTPNSDFSDSRVSGEGQASRPNSGSDKQKAESAGCVTDDDLRSLRMDRMESLNSKMSELEKLVMDSFDKFGIRFSVDTAIRSSLCSVKDMFSSSLNEILKMCSHARADARELTTELEGVSEQWEASFARLNQMNGERVRRVKVAQAKALQKELKTLEKQMAEEWQKKLKIRERHVSVETRQKVEKESKQKSKRIASLEAELETARDEINSLRTSYRDDIERLKRSFHEKFSSSLADRDKIARNRTHTLSSLVSELKSKLVKSEKHAAEKSEQLCEQIEFIREQNEHFVNKLNLQHEKSDEAQEIFRAEISKLRSELSSQSDTHREQLTARETQSDTQMEQVSEKVKEVVRTKDEQITTLRHQLECERAKLTRTTALLGKHANRMDDSLNIG
eukprot:304776_1